MSFDFKNLSKTHYTQGGFLYMSAGLLSESHLSIKPDFLQLTTIPNHFRFVIKSTRSKFHDLGKMSRYEHCYPLDLEHPPKDPTRRLGPRMCYYAVVVQPLRDGTSCKALVTGGMHFSKGIVGPQSPPASGFLF